MRIAITSEGQAMPARVDPRFGRTKWFVVYDSETDKWEWLGNTQALNLPQGAGIQAAQNVIPHKPDVVLTGNCGPKAFKVLQAAGVKAALGVKGKIRDTLQDFVEGKLQPADEANVEGHWV